MKILNYINKNLTISSNLVVYPFLFLNIFYSSVLMLSFDLFQSFYFYFLLVIVFYLAIITDYIIHGSYQQYILHELPKEFNEEILSEAINSNFKNDFIVILSLRFTDENHFLGFNLTWLN